jgi:hypothetical protein
MRVYAGERACLRVARALSSALSSPLSYPECSGRDGSDQRRPSKRPKSRSKETISAECSSASAARCASPSSVKLLARTELANQLIILELVGNAQRLVQRDPGLETHAEVGVLARGPSPWCGGASPALMTAALNEMPRSFMRRLIRAGVWSDGCTHVDASRRCCDALMHGLARSGLVEVDTNREHLAPRREAAQQDAVESIAGPAAAELTVTRAGVVLRQHVGGA